jgi:hypothetical protein
MTKASGMNMMNMRITVVGTKLNKWIVQIGPG